MDFSCLVLGGQLAPRPRPLSMIVVRASGGGRAVERGGAGGGGGGVGERGGRGGVECGVPRVARGGVQRGGVGGGGRPAGEGGLVELARDGSRREWTFGEVAERSARM